MISTVHVVFKTHLDLGFTDSAKRVTDRYVHEYLPRAIALSKELESRNGAARFIWTTGSWLIHEALRLGTAQEQVELEQAIKDGQVRWHALPMTTHTELMDVPLFEHGVAVGRALDARFGLRTTASKMTDVPGHTLGMVPHMAKAGLNYLHLGVNAASSVPDVPEFFVWRAPDGSEIVVNYAQDYGATDVGLAVVPGGTHGLHLAHTGDNFGPPPADDVEDIFARLAAAYPGASIIASTLDAFAQEVLKVRDSLPVITQEIGDSWIHGIGSDPVQTAHLLELMRLRNAWVSAGDLEVGSPEYNAFSDALLLVVEHTWGKDLKSYLPDYVNYTKADFTAARLRNVIDVANNPAELEEYLWGYNDRQDKEIEISYANFEASWVEQRGHVTRALEALSDERKAAAVAALDGLKPSSDSVTGAGLDLAAAHEVPGLTVRLGGDGALISAVDGQGVQWAGIDNPLGAYTYQTFDERDEQRWMEEYCRDMDKWGYWAVPDQSKPGLNIASTLPATVFAPTCVRATRVDDENGTTITAELAVPETASNDWGAPREITVSYRFDGATPGQISVTLDLKNKDASRLPEAGWMTFNPAQAEGRWTLTKLDLEVDPTDVVTKGGHKLHAVTAVNRDGAQPVRISPLDSPLVAVGQPGIYRFDNRVPNPDLGSHFNLHNNFWGTNFTMWFEEDMRYRFTVSLGA